MSTQRLLKARPVKLITVEMAKAIDGVYLAMMQNRVHLEYEVNLHVDYNGNPLGLPSQNELMHIEFCENNCKSMWAHELIIDEDDKLFEQMRNAPYRLDRDSTVKVKASSVVMFYLREDYEMFLKDFAMLKRLEA